LLSSEPLIYGSEEKLAPTMRQTHVAGDKLFVDWDGDMVPIVDPMTGEVHEAHLFIAAFGASSYIPTRQVEQFDRDTISANNLAAAGRRRWPIDC